MAASAILELLLWRLLLLCCLLLLDLERELLDLLECVVEVIVSLSKGSGVELKYDKGETLYYIVHTSHKIKNCFSIMTFVFFNCSESLVKSVGQFPQQDKQQDFAHA